MRAFIIRPFGVKSGINFDAVEEKLIGPALARLGVAGRTTGEILRAGNIREDMFNLLLTADLVIADISIHNANVFYELGLRHALRDKRTFLIRSSADDVPFDVKTDRYFSYDKDGPAAQLDGLVEALRRTLNSEARDSPLFRLLPKLRPADPSVYQVVPLSFQEEARRAEAAGRAGDLALLAEELQTLEIPWASSGLAVVGEAQYGLGAYEAARVTWERLREYDRFAYQPNRRLATIYQRLGRPERSDEAVARALRNPDLDSYRRAEIRSLGASNLKSRWVADWQDAAPEGRRDAALASAYLGESFEAYSRAFFEDCNHFYSGLNALAFVTIQSALAEALPDRWSGQFESDDEAELRLKKLERQRRDLAAAVECSITAAKHRLERLDQQDRWVEISFADLACLTSTRPSRVEALYRRGLAGADLGEIHAVKRQLKILADLQIMPHNAAAGQGAAAAEESRFDRAELEDEEQKQKQGFPAKVLVFSGHRIDAPGRDKPRFPASAEDKARAMIEEKVQEELQGVAGPVIAYAGGASGGDILFHEICRERGVESRLYLALPRNEYVAASVADAGPGWVTRFDKLLEEGPAEVLGDSRNLPRWLRDVKNYSVWQRSNLWILSNALAHGAHRAVLIALWNGEAGDGPGGTADMVERARRQGAKVHVLDAKKLVE